MQSDDIGGRELKVVGKLNGDGITIRSANDPEGAGSLANLG